MRRVIVGTAGHIDHGKTSLVAALTGIDCDRWIEEKERGITIDLGFAHLTEGDLQLGFVDVPGHERFIHNALAGLGGIRLMMLVVAADEGVKPQTREHLDICSLLQIPAGLAVLTKADLVEEDLLELAQLELEEALEGTPFEGLPVVTVSSKSGRGIPDLRDTLLELAAQAQLEDAWLQQGARLPIDRAFHLKGLGVLVTGTLHRGKIDAGSSLELQPGGLQARVRSIQVHGEERQQAIAGERTSLQLSGIELSQVRRGHELLAPGHYQSTRRLLVRVRLLPNAPAPFEGTTAVRFHMLAAERLAHLRMLDRDRLEPGDEGIAEIRLREPVVAARGDRFVLRRPSPETTLGGGPILDPRWTRPHKEQRPRVLEALGGDDDRALLEWSRRGGAGGVELPALALRFGWPAAWVDRRLKKLVEKQKMLATPAGAGHDRRFLVPEAYREIADRAPDVLRAFFKEQRLAPGMPKAEALAAILPKRAQVLADVYLDWLSRQKVLVIQGDRLNLPGRSTGLTPEESELGERIVQAFEEAGLSPPSPPEICRAIGAKQQIFDGVLRYLTTQKRVHRLPSGLFIARSVLDQLIVDVRGKDWEGFSVPEFKDNFGLSRKWAIPLLEYLDAKAVTRREGDRRRVVRGRGS